MSGDCVLVADFSASLYIGLLSGDGRILASRIRQQGERAESAHDLLDACMREAGLGYAALGSLCVGVGPGSFTGIRVAAALMEGLAFARRLPIHPFSSLAALRACAPENTVSSAAVIAGNAGKYFVSHGAPAFEVLLSAEEVESLAAACPALITSGNIPDGERFARVFPSVSRMEAAADFSLIARIAASRPAVVDGVIKPNYIVASAAEEKRLAAAREHPPC